MIAPVVLPTYNERPNLERVAAGIRAPRLHALRVVDDGDNQQQSEPWSDAGVSGKRNNCSRGLLRGRW
jgi:hypothetical protein